MGHCMLAKMSWHKYWLISDAIEIGLSLTTWTGRMYSPWTDNENTLYEGKEKLESLQRQLTFFLLKWCFSVHALRRKERANVTVPTSDLQLLQDRVSLPTSHCTNFLSCEENMQGLEKGHLFSQSHLPPIMKNNVLLKKTLFLYILPISSPPPGLNLCS
jgi:hypothetical protein